MVEPGRVEATPRHTGTIVGLALLALGVHVAVNVLGGYGWFRDELYYIACSKRLAAGYVDQPPLSIFLMAATKFLLGDSVFAIRLIPALASGLSTAVICLLVRRVGGGRAAMVLASLAFLASPRLQGFFAFYSMNSLDILFWLLAAYALLVLRIFAIALAARDRVGAVFAGCAGFVIATQTFVNVAMVTGLSPTTGITLPLLSYGGSSVLATCVMLGLINSIWRLRYANA